MPSAVRPIAQPEDELTSTGWPRLLTRQRAAWYLSMSTRELDRLIASGTIGTVRLPGSRHDGTPTPEARRVLIDRLELDRLVTSRIERTDR